MYIITKDKISNMYKTRSSEPFLLGPMKGFGPLAPVYVHYSTAQYSTTEHNTIYHSTVQLSILQYNPITEI